MGNRKLNVLVIVLVLGLAAASLLVIASKETKLGLDLSGGTRLIYQGQPNAQNPVVEAEDVDRAIEIIRERVDEFGVAEPEISRIGQDQIQVDLPDVQDAQRASDQVGETAQLFFYDWEPNVIPLDPDAPDATDRTIPELIDAVRLAAEQEPECRGCTTNGPTYYLFDRDTEEPIAGPEPRRADLFISPEAEQLPREDRLIIEVPQGTVVVRADEQAAAVPGYFVLQDRPELTGEDITNPEQNFDPTTNQPNVTFDFTGDGRQKFQEVTERIANRGLEELIPGVTPSDEAAGHFAIVLDEDIVSRPIIDPEENPEGIDGRTGAQISGGFTITEAQDLARLLRIGALPIELKEISQSTVSATLGQQALDDGVKAGAAGLILVVLFLIAYYRFLGLVAAIGIGVYGIYFFALIKLIPITLTLPGMAGLILTIGVAADSNVVIFERIKEEVRGGKSSLSAIATGYRRGIATIIDANVITLLTAFILFGLATAGVKGFAFALGIGVFVSLFTAVVFTQAVLGVLGRSRFLTSPKFLGAGEQMVSWRYDFAGASKYFFSASGVILLIGAVSFATNQLNFGIDFESGTRIRAAIEQPVDTDAVRDSLARAGAEEVEGAKIQEVEEPEFGPNVVQIQLQTLEPEQVGGVQDQLDEDFGLVSEDTFESDSVGPTFGEQIARSAILAIAFSLVLIAAYVAFRFEAKYAIPVMIAVIHDILITGGIYSLTDREVTSATVAAFLTILGYSLYDTVIVFDRIRENVPRLPRATFAQIANRSLSEVLTRSLITGLSTVFLIAVVLVFGDETLRDFAFAMMVGVLSGTYSSIFIGTPVLIAWKEREHGYSGRRARITEAMGYVPPFPEQNVVAKLGDEEPEEEEEPTEPEAAVAQNVVDRQEVMAEDLEPEVDGSLTPEQAAEVERRRELKKRRREQRKQQGRKHGRNR